MKKLLCPRCQKELINLGMDCNEFVCDDCGLTIAVSEHDDNPVAIEGEKIRVEWYNANEGLCGDYNPEDPDDINLLRFDVYRVVRDDYEAVEDASYCTETPADTDIGALIKGLYIIYKEYDDVIDSGCSVKKLGERLSWIHAGKGELV